MKHGTPISRRGNFISAMTALSIGKKFEAWHDCMKMLQEFVL
ncbi:hypothetical Protein YC6258_04978 [Gynuella sunshinyii YC6258]|uniref:Uncharacterized protein n=1 Tax=Gynuella sunshinyii YC6258 TaxID=1445510 RepID=A0A0C5VCE1_9GAMM|nr:hypothetical Protein YC6258_04978 [Gynuella sunshinyii YC6258]